jgi:hypothetical protein
VEAGLVVVKVGVAWVRVKMSLGRVIWIVEEGVNWG